MYVSFAADADAMKAFVKFLVYVYKSENKYSAAEIKRIMTLYEEAEPVLEQFKIVRSTGRVASGISYNNLHDADVVSYFKDLYDKREKFKKDISIKKEQLGVINDVRLAKTGSESATKRLLSNISLLGDPHLNKMFLHEDDVAVDHSAQNEVYKDLETHVRKYGKVSGNVMPEEVLEKWRETAKKRGANLPEHQLYLDLRRKRRDIAAKAIANIVRSSGQPYLDVDVIRKKLGHVQHDIPKWFVGGMDDKTNYYTSDGLKLLNKPVGEGSMNPTYKHGSSVYYCQYKAPFAQNFSNVYTIKARTEGRVEKFEVVQAMIPDLDKYIKKWLPDLAKGPGSLRGTAAAVCEVIYQTSARISSTAAKTAGETTYGISTLQRRHVNFNDQRIILKYKGKKAVDQKHVIKFNDQRTEMLHGVLVDFISDRARDEYIFTFRGKPLSNTQINTYLRELGFPEKFTVHMFRKLRGTAMAKKLMDKCPLGKNAKDTEVNKWIIAQCEKIGKELGHVSGEKVTATTAIANYIDPSVFAPIYEKTNTRPNSAIQRAIDLATKDKD